MMSCHALYAVRGVVVLRNCSITSSSGPVVVAQNPGTRVIAQACAVHNGAQGGILSTHGAFISIQQTHCCHHKAMGLELRNGGSAFIEMSHFYSNGLQGIMAWKLAGPLSVKDSFIHSNAVDSGVLVGESEASLESCKVFGNGVAGIAAQQKGKLFLSKCEIHDNFEGVLIQGTSSGNVEHCHIHSNRANGIFVGFDHQGEVALTENKVIANASCGILVGCSSNVVLRDKIEHGNRGLPPPMPKITPQHPPISSNYLKKLKKKQSINR